METMINLNDLLKHEILDLYSAEEQIIEAMPTMIEKAKNPELKKALREHLKITEEQKGRLDKVKQTFGEGDGQNGEGGENKGFFSRLFGGSNGGEKCRGMEGLITEGEKIMAADITDEALDAAIIASAQKIEHYEICGYGTARAFAKELQLAEVERLLTQTLNEEYEADDRLTALAVGKLNIEAEQADGMDGNVSSGRSNNSSSNGSSSKSSSSKSKSKSSSGVSSSKAAASKSAGRSSGGSSSKTRSSKVSKPSGGSRVSSSKIGSKSSAAGRGGSSKVTGRSSGIKAGKSKTASKTAIKGSASRSGSKSSSKSKGAKKGNSRGR